MTPQTLSLSRKHAIASAILVTASSLTTFAQGTPSSKATAAINITVGCTASSASTLGDPPVQSCHDIFSGVAVDVTADHFARIMKTIVKLSNSQSLFVTPSLVTGLYTSTKTKNSPGSGTSTAVARKIARHLDTGGPSALNRQIGTIIPI